MLTKILWLIRDLREFCRSAISRNWHTRGIFSMCPEPKQWGYDQWPKWNETHRTAWTWTYRNRMVQEALTDRSVDTGCQ